MLLKARAVGTDNLPWLDVVRLETNVRRKPPSTDPYVSVEETRALIEQHRAVPIVQLEDIDLSPAVRKALPQMYVALATTNGAAVLSFLDSPLGALGGLTPRLSIERGQVERVLSLAEHDGY